METSTTTQIEVQQQQQQKKRRSINQGEGTVQSQTLLQPQHLTNLFFRDIQVLVRLLVQHRIAVEQTSKVGGQSRGETEGRA